jgi:hypothetical protein
MLNIKYTIKQVLRFPSWEESMTCDFKKRQQEMTILIMIQHIWAMVQL